MSPEKDVDQERGIHYADGGVVFGTVCYPDPVRMAQITAEWENQEEE